ncbi:glycosyltransferase [Evansella sp. LMS18]|uniref:glycosyltransferase n=1 Tax=Evansella sp. LMS18 TaxID=2924033 RepID=UPI0020D05498|nr:glycosyltransferase [Evansella sp. LMS18]UTR10574.1 glycosyltransferase [Evansella sp. LMS18]
MPPEISVIVPVHNAGPYLRDCVDSILAQMFTNLEVILVNDGSSDNSGSICDEYSKKDTRVIVIHQGCKGVSSARNVGVAAAQGNYIGFVDGDDHIAPHMYEELHSLCVNTDSDIAVCRLGREIDGKIINPVSNEYTKELDHTEALRELFRGKLYRFSLCNKLFKKSCFDNIKFPEGRIHEDLSTTYRLFANSSKTVFKDFIGYLYVKRSNSILTSTFSEKRLDAFTGWEEIVDYMTAEYPQLSDEVLAAFTYGCIDNMYYIINQVDDREKQLDFLSAIQRPVRKYYKEIITNSILNKKYKYLIRTINYDFRLLLYFNQIKRQLARA